MKSKPWLQRAVKGLLVVLPFPLLWWSFRQASLAQILQVLGQIDPLSIGVWLGFNILLAWGMVARWWLVLLTLGQRVPYWALLRYRYIAQAVSYFTPGPQFGGEPVQVYALKTRHAIPAVTGTASVSLDRLLELIANFSFLVVGIFIALAGAWAPAVWRRAGMRLALGLLSLPLAYLIAMLLGRRPLTAWIDRLPLRLRTHWLAANIRLVEAEMSGFCVAHPGSVLLASLMSLAVWAGMVGEYALLTRALGLDLTWPQIISALVAARLAFLTPLPGGLGALEASQMLALSLLGLPEAAGVSLALLIRGRDLLFGSIGLVMGLPLLRRPPASSP